MNEIYSRYYGSSTKLKMYEKYDLCPSISYSFISLLILLSVSDLYNMYKLYVPTCLINKVFSPCLNNLLEFLRCYNIY